MQDVFACNSPVRNAEIALLLFLKHCDDIRNRIRATEIELCRSRRFLYRCRHLGKIGDFARPDGARIGAPIGRAALLVNRIDAQVEVCSLRSSLPSESISTPQRDEIQGKSPARGIGSALERLKLEYAAYRRLRSRNPAPRTNLFEAERRQFGANDFVDLVCENRRRHHSICRMEWGARVSVVPISAETVESNKFG